MILPSIENLPLEFVSRSLWHSVYLSYSHAACCVCILTRPWLDCPHNTGLTLVTGRRRSQMVWRRSVRETPFIQMIVMASYVLAICYQLASIIFCATGVPSLVSCATSWYLCIPVYFAFKLALEMFLIERAHAANIQYTTRRADPVWMLATGSTLILGNGLMIWALCNPNLYMAARDGRCRSTVLPKVIAPAQAYDTIINVFLTASFYRSLRSTEKRLTRAMSCSVSVDKQHVPQNRWYHIGQHCSRWFWRSFETSKPPARESVPTKDSAIHPTVQVTADPINIAAQNPAQSRNLHRLAQRSVIGTLLLLLSTTGSAIATYALQDDYPVWVMLAYTVVDGK